MPSARASTLARVVCLSFTSRRIASRTRGSRIMLSISVRRCDKSGPIAASRSVRNSVRKSRAARRTMRSRSSPSICAMLINSASEIASPNLATTARRKKIIANSVFSRERPPHPSAAHNRSQRKPCNGEPSRSSRSGARPQKMLTGIRCTSVIAPSATAATRRASRCAETPLRSPCSAKNA